MSLAGSNIYTFTLRYKNYFKHIYNILKIIYIKEWKKAIIIAKYVYQIPNKEITTSSQIYSILYPKNNACNIAKKPI